MMIKPTVIAVSIFILCYLRIVAAVDPSPSSQNGNEDSDQTIIQFNTGKLIQNGNPKASSLLFSYVYTRDKNDQANPASSAGTTQKISESNDDLIKPLFRPIIPRSEPPRPFYLPK